MICLRCLNSVMSAMLSTQLVIMAKATCLLVLASAVAISAQPLHCSIASKGTLQGPSYDLEPVNLQPGIADWYVKIPEIPQCGHGLGGAFASVCDYDSKPDNFFIDLHNIFAHRTGQLQGYATVRVKVYCHQQFSPLLGSVPDNQYSLPNQDQSSQAKTLVLKPY